MELNNIAKILDNKTVRDRVTHYFIIMLEYSDPYHMPRLLNAVQFFLYFGRAQELLGCPGGDMAWWGTFKPLIENNKWVEINTLITKYMEIFGL